MPEGNTQNNTSENAPQADNLCHRRYCRQRSILALAGLLFLSLGWVIGESIMIGQDGLLRRIGGSIMLSGLIGGPIIIIVGNIILYRRHKKLP